MSVNHWRVALALVFCAAASVRAEDAKPTYPSMAPFLQYAMPSADEVALAKSSAPPSVAANAEVLTLGTKGYETAVKGTNGFVCLVERSWANNIDDPEFWNPKLRGPMCLNAAAARSVLPGYLERTEWVLTGVPRADMLARVKASIAAKSFLMPEPGAMCFMLSKDGFLSDDDGHWHPHVMFFVGNTEAAAWGANMKGSPILAAPNDPEPVTIFFIPVSKWSDGSSAVMDMH